MLEFSPAVRIQVKQRKMRFDVRDRFGVDVNGALNPRIVNAASSRSSQSLLPSMRQ